MLIPSDTESREVKQMRLVQASAQFHCPHTAKLPVEKLAGTGKRLGRERRAMWRNFLPFLGSICLLAEAERCQVIDIKGSYFGKDMVPRMRRIKFSIVLRKGFVKRLT